MRERVWTEAFVMVDVRHYQLVYTVKPIIKVMWPLHSYIA